jgi:hypothetical protein
MLVVFSNSIETLDILFEESVILKRLFDIVEFEINEWIIAIRAKRIEEMVKAKLKYATNFSFSPTFMVNSIIMIDERITVI